MQEKQKYDPGHTPVLTEEIIEGLSKYKAHLNKPVKVIDATLGLAGHTLRFLEEGFTVLGVDTDPIMLRDASDRLKQEGAKEQNYTLVHGNFKDLEKIAKDNDFAQVEAVIFDLGLNSMHLYSANRGFSFKHKNAFLDLRLDPKNQAVKGADLLNMLRPEQLVEMFSKVLNPAVARLISRKVVESRAQKAFITVGDFTNLLEGIRFRNAKLDSATLPLMALRIAVNSEYENLVAGLDHAYRLLVKGGRLAVISFHSGEDQIVKDFFRKKRSDGQAELITEKPIVPTDNEIINNLRSRSAKLRILEKI